VNSYTSGKVETCLTAGEFWIGRAFLVPAAQNISGKFGGPPLIARLDRQNSVGGWLRVCGGPHVAPAFLDLVQAPALYIQLTFIILVAADDELARGWAGREGDVDLDQVFRRSITVAEETAVQLGAFGGIDRLLLGMAEAENQEKCEEIAVHFRSNSVRTNSDDRPTTSSGRRWGW